LIAAVGSCLAFGTAHAAERDAAERDYEVAYAVDAFGSKETGRLEQCSYKYACRIALGIKSIVIYIMFEPRRGRYTFVHIDSSASCCVFSGAAKDVQLDTSDRRQRIHRLPIFVGRARRGNEFIVGNEMVGTLYLAFAKLK
jgi:hypothetical protein